MVAGVGGLLDEVRLLVDRQQRRARPVDLPPGGGGGGGGGMIRTRKLCRAHMDEFSRNQKGRGSSVIRKGNKTDCDMNVYILVAVGEC